MASHATEGFACPSSRRAYTCLIGWNEGKTAEKKTTDQRRCVETSGRIEPEVAIAGGLAHHFLGLIRRSDVGGFDHRLVKASHCAAPELRAFAVDIEADLSAVRAAFTPR